MKISLRLSGLFAAGMFLTTSANAQIAMSGGTYSQNFDSLANSGTANTWTDDSILPGWYASKSITPNAVTTYRADNGSGNTGALYSFGSTGSTERALGSVASGTPGNFAYGVRLTNDTAVAVSNITVSYTGEQWRNGGNISAQKLTFSCLAGSGPLTNSDAASANSWTAFTNLDFTTPMTGATSATLDGNNPTNQQIFTNVVLSGVAVQPGQEIFLRWFDANDSGNDHAVAIDNLTISFQAVGASPPPTNSAPVITSQPQSQTNNAGDTVTFTVVATGNPPPDYQWQSNSIAVPGATNSTFALSGVTTNLSGSVFFVTITNVAGSTNSANATLTVNPTASVLVFTNGGITLMTYNVKGNGVADWSTNAAQVQAIGREIMYLHPDIITFNEIPDTNAWQMPNWVKAFMPGYFLATNSGTDGFIRSTIASRFPINRSQSWLTHADLTPFGYSGTFTRDLFEAEIAVPNWPLPLHVFTTHLKSGSTATDAQRRTGEAGAITNFLATNFFALHPSDPFTLSGDMNDSDTNALAIQRLTSAPTTLRLTNPTNPVSGSINTFSIQGGLSERIDFIFPCALLFSNIAGSQVFRTDLLTNFPSNLFSNDDKIASDHLPVLMTFANPFNTPFRLLSFGVTNQTVTLKWESQNNRVFNIEASTNLTTWTPFVTNIISTTTNPAFAFSTNFTGSLRFFRIYRVP